MQTLDQLREEHAKELATAEHNHAMQLAVTEALGLSDDNWSAGFMHVHKADCHIKMVADTLSDALVLAERMNPLAMVRVKGSSLSFYAEESLTEKDRERNEITPICPWVYKIHGISGYPVNKTFIFHIKAAGYLVQVRVDVKDDPDTTRSTYQPRDSEGRKTGPLETTLHNGSGHFTHYARWWASPDEPKDFTLYSL